MLTVTRAAVKRKLRLTTNEYDSEIDALIDEMVPALRYAIDPDYLNSHDADLRATLNLGALEVVAGEMGATLYRELGAWTGFRLGWLQVDPPALRNPRDPTGLKAQGYARLKPFLKRDAQLLYLYREREEETE
ncbi:MAG: hypothetical protein CFK49_11450 [Armatimonadetes bacterium JP3_11]|jgi:hypothetical protein|nr:MAG: hypothetical protein CFK48_08795 [Armatimonadetes bacterium CP1_7O]OYT71051.1 MAG: hypothetical protein CFK49_11450 [Armatimonadetes bacterium JP3_11]RMH06842.1 MAG: hypothetical protein D6697_09920 [Armatimonadota bacterium]